MGEKGNVMKITVVEASTKDTSKDVLEKAQKTIKDITMMFRAIYNMDGEVFDLELQDDTVLRVERTDTDGTFLLSRPDRLDADERHMVCRKPDDDLAIIYKPGTKASSVISMMAYLIGEADPEFIMTGDYIRRVMRASKEWKAENA